MIAALTAASSLNRVARIAAHTDFQVQNPVFSLWKPSHYNRLNNSLIAVLEL
jgi:hypothetical protein